MQKFNVGDGVYFGGSDNDRYLLCLTGDGAGYERIGGEFVWRAGAREVVHIDLFDNSVDSEDGSDVLMSIGLVTEPICGVDEYATATFGICELFGEIYEILSGDDCRVVDNIRQWLPDILCGEICEIYVKG